MNVKTLKAKGESDYDYLEDILFFKIKNREYDRSFEFDNFVIDIDKEDFVVGIQIFDASEYLRVNKTILRDIKKWKFCSLVHENKIEIRLFFEVVLRNKVIEKEPIITRSWENRELPTSKAICVTV